MSLFGYMTGPTIDSPRMFNGRSYPDPFMAYSTLLMPRTIEEVLRWAETVWHRSSTYSAACRRVVSYFLTKLDLTDADDGLVKKRKKFYEQTLDVMTNLNAVGQDFMAYGNSFSSVYLPFRRFLRCAHCGIETPIDKVQYKFQSFKFSWNCKACKKVSVADRPVDRRTLEESRVKIIRWQPTFIRIRHNPVSQKNEYLYDPPAVLKRAVREGDPLILAETNWELIEAIKANKLFKFNDKSIFHMREFGLAGVQAGGWGIPRLMSNFSQAFHVQLLKLYNEVLAHEYIVPFRVISPAQAGSGGAGDPMIHQDLRGFTGSINNVLRQFRRNPGGWFVSPHALQYQALGAEGLQMNTSELINQAVDEMLNAAGVPAELYRGSLQLTAVPFALRLFQQQWPHFVAGCNAWLRWLDSALCVAFNWDSIEIQLTPPTIADDIENKQLLLQLAAANQVSKSVAFAPLGVDQTKNMEQLIREQEVQEKLMAEYQQRQQQRQVLTQQLQSAPMQAAGVQQAPGSPTPGTTPGDIMAKAQQIAGQLLSMPEANRKTELAKIRKTDEVLWSTVKTKMEGMRTQAEGQGRQQMYQQLQSQGHP